MPASIVSSNVAYIPQSSSQADQTIPQIPSDNQPSTSADVSISYEEINSDLAAQSAQSAEPPQTLSALSSLAPFYRDRVSSSLAGLATWPSIFPAPVFVAPPFIVPQAAGNVQAVVSTDAIRFVPPDKFCPAIRKYFCIYSSCF